MRTQSSAQSVAWCGEDAVVESVDPVVPRALFLTAIVIGAVGGKRVSGCHIHRMRGTCDGHGSETDRTSVVVGCC